MAYVSEGPVSTIPGSRLRLPEGCMCDVHPDRKAVARVQGETDSMGCEAADLCQECLDDRAREEKERDRSGVCDLCKSFMSELRPWRDYEEGSSGRIYMICVQCRDDRNRAEAEDWDDPESDWWD